MWTSGVIGLHAATSPQQLRELAPLSLGIFADLAEKGPTEQELARAKAQIKAGLFMSLESCEARAGQLAWDLMVFGRPISNEELIDKIDGITREDVQAIGRSFRAKPDMVSAVVGRAWFGGGSGRHGGSFPVRRSLLRDRPRMLGGAHVLFREQAPRRGRRGLSPRAANVRLQGVGGAARGKPRLS